MLVKRPWTVVSFIFNITRSYRLYIAGMALATIVWAIDDSIVRPYLLKLLLEILAVPATPESWSMLVQVLVIYAIARTIITLLVRLWDWLHARMVPAIKASAMEFLSDYVMGHAYDFLQQYGAGALASSIHTAADGAPQLLIPFVGRFLGSACRVLFALGLLWFTLPKAAFFMTLWVVFFLGGGVLWAQASRSLADVASSTYAQITGTVVDLMLNRMAVLLFNHRPHEAKITKRWGIAWIEAERNRDMALIRLYLLQGITFVVCELFALWVVVQGWLAGSMSAGDAGLVVSINMVLLEALWDIPQEVTQFVRALGRVSQGLRIVVVPYTIADVPGASALRVAHGAIDFENVTFAYPGSPPLFRTLSVRIEAGQKVGIVGYSGSGKTTFVHLLLRFFEIESGVIRIDGNPIAQATQYSLREAVTLLPQDPVLFRRSIRENICYGNLQASELSMIAAADAAGVHEAIIALPHGYDTIVGADGVYLSTGQRQRIIVARVLLRNTPIVIMDEATNALDSVAERALQDGMRVIMKGKTAIIIAHRLSTLLAVDRILVFDRGAIVEDGTHDELLARRGKYYQLWSTQICAVPM